MKLSDYITPKWSSILLSLMILLLVSCTGCEETKPDEPMDDPVAFSTPAEAVPLMMRGINLGNTLEPPDEGGWNNPPAEEYYFDDYVEAGFKTVRIPVKWGSHSLENPPFLVDPAWMDRVEEVVDWGLDRDLFIILNAHHEGWIKEDYSPTNHARFVAIWEQISTRFMDKPSKLFFEMINEPHGMEAAEVDTLNLAVLAKIRETNPERIVIFSGHGWSSINDMLSAAIPDDENLMGYWHSYDPWRFGGEAQGLWGSPQERAEISAMFQRASSWVTDTQIPAMISEFGAVHDCDYNSRMRHYATFVEEALRNNIPFQAWDDGGWFKIYEREDRSWPEVKDILIHGHYESPTDLTLNSFSNGSVLLTWTSRSSAQTGLIVEYREAGESFAPLDTLAKTASEYIHSGVVGDKSYDYRVLSIIDDETTHYSYPIRITI